MGSKKRIVPVRSVLTLGAFGQHEVINSSIRGLTGMALLGAGAMPRYTDPMKLIRVICLGLAMLPALACAQWQWIDKDGRKVFSDRSPPSDIPARNILKQPGGKAPPVPAEAEAAGSAAGAADAAADAAAKAASQAGSKTAANMPKVSGKDKLLEEKKKAAEQEQEATKKAADEKFARDKAENCERAKRSLQAFTSGQRIRAINAKGESEFLTDEQRAAETKRLQGITAECKT